MTFNSSMTAGGAASSRMFRSMKVRSSRSRKGTWTIARNRPDAQATESLWLRRSRASTKRVAIEIEARGNGRDAKKLDSTGAVVVLHTARFGAGEPGRTQRNAMQRFQTRGDAYAFASARFPASQQSAVR